MNIHRTLLTAALLTTFAIGAPASAAPASAFLTVAASCA